MMRSLSPLIKEKLTNFNSHFAWENSSRISTSQLNEPIPQTEDVANDYSFDGMYIELWLARMF